MKDLANYHYQDIDTAHLKSILEYFVLIAGIDEFFVVDLAIIQR